MGLLRTCQTPRAVRPPWSLAQLATGSSAAQPAAEQAARDLEVQTLQAAMEEAYEVRFCLESLVGSWHDTQGSTYEVSIERSAVTIRTTRPDGKVLFSPGLVRMNSQSGRIVWGRSGPTKEYWLTKLNSRSLKWESQHAKSFTWYRVGRSEEGRATSSSSEAQGQQSLCGIVALGKQARSPKGPCSHEDERGGSGSAVSLGRKRARLAPPPTLHSQQGAAHKRTFFDTPAYFSLPTGCTHPRGGSGHLKKLRGTRPAVVLWDCGTGEADSLPEGCVQP